MEYRFLGASGIKVPVLNFGTATFGGKNDFFKPGEARRLMRQND
jgi:aryl-alcohol dehydrogenase-like predicted oxidoreductase